MRYIMGSMGFAQGFFLASCLILSRPSLLNCFRLCNGTTVLGALPGSGWDNLNNLEESRVVAMNYSQCLVTEDGKLLIPDDMQVFPVKNSKANIASTITEHMHDYQSADSVSINMHMKLSFAVSIQASFSSDYRKTKERTSKENTKLSRSELKYHLYTAITKPSISLNPEFKERIMNIAYNLQEGENATARYNAQRLVADYGTHYIDRVFIGASLVQEDLVRSDYIKNMNTLNVDISARAGASFLSKFKFELETNYSHSQKDIDEYRRNCTETKLVTYGGPPYRQNFSINNWIDHLDNDLVVIDRDGDLLSAMVSPERLPGIPISIVQKTSFTVQKAIEAYYAFNTYPGCTDVTSNNYNYAANVDDKSCIQPSNNHTFGGIYQMCHERPGNSYHSCNGMTQINPQTGRFTCPPSYKAHLLQKVQVGIKKSKCKNIAWWRKKCEDDWSASYEYEIYWCAAAGAVSKDSGYLFGGAYTVNTENVMTGEKSCPDKFTGIKVGGNQKITICLSDDYELGFKNSIPFGGFYSCTQGNPLSETNPTHVRSLATGLQTLATYQAKMDKSPMKCPSGFSPHLLSINEDCAIHYCLESNNVAQFKGKLPMVRRPPYGDRPLEYGTIPEPIKVLYTADADAVWLKKPMDNGWHVVATAQLADMKAPSEPEVTIDQEDESNHGVNSTVIALSVVAGTLGCIAIALSISLYKKVKKGKKGYDAIQRPLLREEGLGVYGACDQEEACIEVSTD